MIKNVKNRRGIINLFLLHYPFNIFIIIIIITYKHLRYDDGRKNPRRIRIFKKNG